MTIPYGRQSLDEDDVAAVVAVLRGDWLTQGPAVERFENDLAARVGARFAVSFANGTAALHAAAAAAELGPGNIVATSPLSFAASAACAAYVGATPSYIDIRAETFNMSLSDLPETVDAAVVVHFAGLPADLREFGFRPRVVIEDAAHALGATTPYGPVGNCRLSDMCCFSFHPVKAITTGEGGAVTTNDPELADRLRTFRHHGIRRTTEWLYEIPALGYNYRLTDIHAALGSSQLRKLDKFIDRRRTIANRYRSLLQGFDLGLPPKSEDGFTHAHHLFTVTVPRRDEVVRRMRQLGVGVQVHYVPIYRHAAYASGAEPGDFPVTEQVSNSIMSLPVYPDLSEQEQQAVVDALRRTLADLAQ